MVIGNSEQVGVIIAELEILGEMVGEGGTNQISIVDGGMSISENTCFFWHFQTSDTLKYHVVELYLTEETIRNGEEFPTWLGMDYLLKITKPGEGMVCINKL